ncbi:MAG: 4'-phosphopantetheinyl transferase superfamily protein [Gemmatimonadetes bacterium]|nr:4'-phosphopantetheinyl transferase superfamily protein [Gemmatimonadota bacterium]
MDLEAVRPVPEAESIIESFFSPAERRAFLTVPAEARDGAFFACWTRKEAFIKALGGGLSIPLDDFDVTLAPGEPARLLAVRGLSADEWTLREIDPGPGWAGAVAVEGGAFAMRFFDWDLGAASGA